MAFVPLQILAHLDHKTREKEIAYIKGKRNICMSFGWKV
jgi:hypothetical protein